MQKSKLQLKIQKFLLRIWPVLFIIAIWFVFAYSYFLKGLVPYASTYQANFFAPWSHYEEFNSPIKNNAMPDVHTQIYPWKKFTIDALRSGYLPFWNPYNFAGNPHLANVQSAVLSPLNLLFLFLPFVDAWSILVLLQPLLAGVFMYLLMRSLKVSQLGSTTGSIVFMFSGFVVVWMAYGTLAYAILYLPLALFAIEKYSQTNRFWFLFLLTLAIPLSFFSGHFQISLYFFLTVVAYIMFKGVSMRKSFIIYHLSFIILLGLVLSLPQLLPSIELYRHSVRSELFQLGEAIPFQYLITIIAPDFFGNPVTRNDWFGHYAEWAGFIGIWPLVLALYAIFRRKAKNGKRKTIIFFAVLGTVSLIFAVSSPLSNLLVSLKIPVISTSALSRIIVLFSFAFAVLAGLGMDQLIRDIRERGASKKNVTLFWVSGAFFVSIWLLLFFSNIYPQEWLIVAKRNFVLSTILFFAGSTVVLAAIKNKKFLVISSWLLVLLISFDSLRNAAKWMPFDPRGLVYPDVPIIEAMKKNIGDGRIFGNLGAEVSSYYGIPSIEGYDPLYIGRYGELLRSAGTGEFLEAERSVAKLARDGMYTNRILDLLGVTLIFHPIPDTYQGWAYPVWKDQERHTLLYKDDKFELYRNNQALSRVSLFYRFEVHNDSRQLLERFFNQDFDFKNTLLLEENPYLSTSQGRGSAHFLSYDQSAIIIGVETTEPALLFLSDNFYPGWKVKVNPTTASGQVEEKIYRADYTFRAVKVPAGESTVEFTYAAL